MCLFLSQCCFLWHFLLLGLSFVIFKGSWSFFCATCNKPGTPCTKPSAQRLKEGFEEDCCRSAMSANTADIDVSNPEQALNLGNIRRLLQRMEDSIIFSLIERAQYRTNSAVYEPMHAQLGKFRLHQLLSVGSNGCLGDWFIYQTECLHSQVRRFEHPTEFAFFEPLPDPLLMKTAERQEVLAPVPSEALVNKRLLELYRRMIADLSNFSCRLFFLDTCAGNVLNTRGSFWRPL